MVRKEEIIRALTLWFQPGDVFEIRALKAITPTRQFEHTESGYFDYEHISEAAEAIEQIRFSSGVYVTINPVKRDLLARAVNKIRYQKDAPTTADSNIIRRKWLLIDCDPIRESGIASSDEEHNAAIEKAKEIRDALTANGWPQPILIDSGNGAHLTYRLDLPTEDTGLVQKVLNTLSEASSEQVDVDISVFNPARIVRIPGTMNCKGDDADGSACGRPHRMAKILEVPQEMAVVTEKQLKILVGMATEQPSMRKDSVNSVYAEDHVSRKNGQFAENRRDSVNSVYAEHADSRKNGQIAENQRDSVNSVYAEDHVSRKSGQIAENQRDSVNSVDSVYAINADFRKNGQFADNSSNFRQDSVNSVDSVYAESHGFDIDQWIAQYAPEAGNPVPYKDGRKWVFSVCPFNAEHTNRSATLIETGDGAIGFRCLHNSCTGNDWRKFRVLREPGCYDHKPLADVDINGILNQAGKEQTTVETEKLKKVESLFPNPGPIPDKLLSVPGFIDEVVNLSMSSAPYPNRVLSFTGALALLAFLVGRKVQDRRDNRSNIYLIALADSGTGKDHPRKVNFNIAFRADVAGAIGDAFASGEGLEDALFSHPSMLFQADEFDCIFNTLKYSKDNRAESINEKLLKFYGASNTIYPMRKKASAKKSDGSSKEIAHIVNPNLVLLGTAIPQYFYESLSRRVLENGLVARCIIVEAGKRGEAGNPQPITPSDSLIRAAKYLTNLDVNGNLVGEYPKPLTIEETPEVTAALKEVQQECDRRYSFFVKHNNGAAMALWARAHEKVCKLAMLHGISSDVYKPVITEKSVRWAWKFIDHQTRRMLYMADSYVYENVFDEKCRRVIRMLRDEGGRLQHSVALNKFHDSVDVFKKVVETLMEQGVLTFEMEATKTRPSKVYVLLE